MDSSAYHRPYAPAVRGANSQLHMLGLYAILDLDTVGRAGIPWLDFARALLKQGPTALQLRAKSTTPRDTLAALRALKPLCVEYGVPLFANDRPDLALFAECDGVHLGQCDLPIAEARKFAPDLRIGISTHDPAQLESALAARPDYVAYGPVFSTLTKADADPVVGLAGLAGLERAGAAARSAQVPLVAIGGITLQNVAELTPHCDQVAVISALLPSDADKAVADLGSGAARFLRALRSTGER